jgi:phage-related protein
MIYSVPPTNTIYFTIPSNTLLSNPTSYIAIDKNPQEEHSIRRIEFGTTPMQTRADGINTKELTFSFRIISSSYSELNLILEYFKQKKGTLHIVLINGLEGGTNKKIVIEEWNVNLKNSIYGDIAAKGKLVYP